MAQVSSHILHIVINRKETSTSSFLRAITTQRLTRSSHTASKIPRRIFPLSSTSEQPINIQHCIVTAFNVKLSQAQLQHPLYDFCDVIFVTLYVVAFVCTVFCSL
ncbi:hypothetical protein XENORESO_014715 [Xenotaenia resolanae]|uniref:Uncharacterized protein n=1 Tax=Xenotaenia resolanae TaxID=208358 RepID=A0ABV0WYM2_9TELE